MADGLSEAVEAIQLARLRVEYRRPLLEEARDGLATCESVSLDDAFGRGRSIRLDDLARDALRRCAEAEIAEIDAQLQAVTARVTIGEIAS